MPRGKNGSRKPKPPAEGPGNKGVERARGQSPSDKAAALIRYLEGLTVTEGRYAGKPLRVLPWQEEVCRAVCTHSTIAMSMARGNGKALALDTPVPTPDGWTTMGAIKTGDRVFGRDGRPVRVLKAHDTLLNRKCYRLTFNTTAHGRGCGETIVCDSEHLWLTHQRHARPGSGHDNRKREKPKLAVRTTQEIVDTLKYPNREHKYNNHHIPVADPLLYDGGDLLPVEPYILGYWLGDGATASGRFTCGEDDAFWLVLRLNIAGYRGSTRKDKGKTAHTVTAYGLRTQLRKAGLLGFKHIPEAYFRASADDRMEVLRGLVDSDGHVMRQGTVEITTVKHRLAEDYVRLIRSLGFRCNMPVPSEAKLNGRVVGERYRVQFHPRKSVVCHMPRKAGHLPLKETWGHSKRHTITAAEEVPSVPVRCITVDAEDNLYLVGKNLIPTHNTALMSAIACAALDPAGPLFLPRGETVLVASSLGQAAIAFDHIHYFMQDKLMMDRQEWRITNNDHRLRIEHRATGTKLKAIGSDSRRAHGLAPSLVICDEPAQWISGGRKMYAALETAKGKQPYSVLVAIGTRSDDPTHWFSELLLGEDDSIWVANHCADDKDPEFALSTIRKANPSYDHLPDLQAVLEIQKQKAMGGGEALHLWRSLRLNMGVPETGEIERLVSVENWKACVREEAEDRGGPMFIGVDLGGGTSMSAVAIYWPETGRLECYGAFPADPNLERRGKEDGVGNRYQRMVDAGEVLIYPGKATNNPRFLRDILKKVEGYPMSKIGADMYKMNDLKHALQSNQINAEDETLVEWRRVGKGPAGTEDINGFQREVLDGHLRMTPNLAMESAIMDSMVTRDTNGNASLDKRRAKGRIDVLQAAIIAVGMGYRWRNPSDDKSLDDFYRKALASETGLAMAIG